MNKQCLGYIPRSWIDPRIEIKPSSISGMGMFATELIKCDETLLIWGGNVFKRKDIIAGRTIKDSAVPIDEDLYIATKINTPRDVAIYTNHSCEPNIWMSDEVTFVARRNIYPGEEINPDYCMWENDNQWVSKWACNCGSENCRRRITGIDWLSVNLQKVYEGYFSPFINKRIDDIQQKL